MIRTIKMSVGSPNIPDNSDLVHLSTSWEVSKLPTFEDAENLVLKSVEDDVNLTVYRMSYDLKPNECLYLRTKFFFNPKDGKVRTTGWSKTIPLRADQIGIKMSNTVVNTPIVSVNRSYDNNLDGELIIETNNMSLFSGIGNHKSTSWVVMDTDGVIVFEREKDEQNLTSIKISLNILNKSKAYIVKARHHTTTNADSNYGKGILSTQTKKLNLFDVWYNYPMTPKRWIYPGLKLNTTEYKSIDILIVDELDNIAAQELDQETRSPKVWTADLLTYRRYFIKARIKFLDGNYSEYKLVGPFIIVPNDLSNQHNSITYLNRHNYVQETQFKGRTVQTTRELMNGDILLTKHEDNKIYSYRMFDKQLVEVGSVFELDTYRDSLSKPYVNILPLNNGRVLIDYSGGDDRGAYREPEFSVFEYNTETRKLTLLHKLSRTDEIYSTALSNSAHVTKKNKVHFIPAKRVGDSNLEMKVYDAEANEIISHVPLPFSAKSHVSLVGLPDDKILVFGGANDPVNDVSTDDVLDNIVEYRRSHDNVWMYDTVNLQWTKVAQLPVDYSREYYNLQAFLRRDGKVVIFNGVISGPKLGNLSPLVFDPIENNFEQGTNDINGNLPFRNNIVLNNGDILRISSRVTDPQRVHTYVSNTVKEEDLSAGETITVVKDLVINPRETRTIESPYEYDTITVLGTSYEDSGLLRWVEGDEIHEFTYKDLIITRSTVIEQNIYNDIKEWDSITILDDVDFEVFNVLHVPDNTDFSIEAPIKVEDIDVGENSDLTIITD